MKKSHHDKLREFSLSLVDKLLDDYNDRVSNYEITKSEHKEFVLMSCALSLTVGTIREIFDEKDWEAFLNSFHELCKVNLEMSRTDHTNVTKDMLN